MNEDWKKELKKKLETLQLQPYYNFFIDHIESLLKERDTLLQTVSMFALQTKCYSTNIELKQAVDRALEFLNAPLRTGVKK